MIILVRVDQVSSFLFYIIRLLRSPIRYCIIHVFLNAEVNYDVNMMVIRNSRVCSNFRCNFRTGTSNFQQLAKIYILDFYNRRLYSTSSGVCLSSYLFWGKNFVTSIRNITGAGRCQAGETYVLMLLTFFNRVMSVWFYMRIDWHVWKNDF